MAHDESTGNRRDGSLRSALFVDFDNIYLGLRKLDEKAAEAFATRPGQWMRWLEEGLDGERATPRRFLIRNVYLNPVAFGSYRALYTRAGFRAIDCPPLTSHGKNSADIYMVLDILDSLERGHHYDDFVIASADADFTPVLQRLRSRDRRTTVLTAGASAAAYRAVCDSYVSPEVLADVALGEYEEAREAATGEPTATGPVAVQVEGAVGGTAAPPSDSDLDEVRRAIHAAVDGASKPIVAALAAQAALKVVPNIKDSAWWNTGSFGAFVAAHVSDLAYSGSPLPGYVFDPERHAISDLPVPEVTELSPLVQRVCLVSGAPGLSSDKYAALFTALVEQLSERAYQRNETEKRVRDRTDLAGKSVGRNSVNFVTQNLIYSGTDLAAGATVPELAEAWVATVKGLCASARMALTPDDETEIESWILGSLR